MHVAKSALHARTNAIDAGILIKNSSFFSEKAPQIDNGSLCYVVLEKVGTKSFSENSCKFVLLSAVFQVEMESVLPDGGFDDWATSK